MTSSFRMAANLLEADFADVHPLLPIPLLLNYKDLLVKLSLQHFVGVIYTKLLKRVLPHYFEAKNIEYANERCGCRRCGALVALVHLQDQVVKEVIIGVLNEGMYVV